MRTLVLCLLVALALLLAAWRGHATTYYVSLTAGAALSGALWAVRGAVLRGLLWLLTARYRQHAGPRRVDSGRRLARPAQS